MMRNNIPQVVCVVMFSLLSMNVNSAEKIYKCKNEQAKLLYQKTPCADNEQSVTSWTPKTTVNTVSQKSTTKITEALVIPQGKGGHYYVNGEVNNHALTFIIDTGATIVSLPYVFAASASIFCKNKTITDTANGKTEVCITTIAELKIGDFVLTDVDVALVRDLSIPLLGMNVLKRFNIEQKDNEMKLIEQ